MLDGVYERGCLMVHVRRCVRGCMYEGVLDGVYERGCLMVHVRRCVRVRKRGCYDCTHEMVHVHRNRRL